MAHPHKDEIIRWANSLEGTKIWHNSNGTWSRVSSVNWKKTTKYIVDDEYAELRMAYADGMEIQIYSKYGSEWKDWKTPDWSLPANAYRIKLYEPKVRELTIAELEKMHGYPIKIVKEK